MRSHANGYTPNPREPEMHMQFRKRKPGILGSDRAVQMQRLSPDSCMRMHPKYSTLITRWGIRRRIPNGYV